MHYFTSDPLCCHILFEKKEEKKEDTLFTHLNKLSILKGKKKKFFFVLDAGNYLVLILDNSCEK